MYVSLMSVLTLMVVFVAGAVGDTPSATGQLTTVDNVNLERYQGKWFEIARYPNRFQKKCVGETTATYSIKKKNVIEVINECRKANGEIDRAKGKAKVVDKNTNAKLKVRFAPAWLSWLPFVWGDYWIIDLDQENYSYAVVGDPSRKYLWILSRTAQLDKDTYKEILKSVEKKGFDPTKLVVTKQTGS